METKKIAEIIQIKLKKIRNDFLIYSGGTTVTKHNDVILTLDWWSSDKNAKFLNDYNCPLKRLFFLEIEKNPEDAYKYTAKGNLVAVISNGTAVLTSGNINTSGGSAQFSFKLASFSIL